jgi:hypothetical protein
LLSPSWKIPGWYYYAVTASFQILSDSSFLSYDMIQHCKIGVTDSVVMKLQDENNTQAGE